MSQRQDDEGTRVADVVPRPRGGQDEDAAAGEGWLKEQLRDGVPICLIMDLAMPTGPHSQELFDDEGLPATPWWEPREAR